MMYRTKAGAIKAAKQKTKTYSETHTVYRQGFSRRAQYFIMRGGSPLVPTDWERIEQFRSL